jgi:4-amino-4-deoxy-L-arabinose transferase-like glycosyltransferase
LARCSWGRYLSLTGAVAALSAAVRQESPRSELSDRVVIATSRSNGSLRVRVTPAINWLTDYYGLLAAVMVAGLVRAIAVALDVKPGYLAGLRATQTEMATNILDHGRWFVTLHEGRFRPEILEMPGLAIVDVVVWTVSGTRSYSVVIGLQVLVDVAMVLLVYWIATRLFRRKRVAVLAAALYAISPAAAVLAKTPSMDTWAGYFLITSCAAYILLHERPDSIRRQILFGVLIGIGIYFRPFLILVPLLLALVDLGGGRRRNAAAIAVSTLTALFLLLPWIIRNAVEFHAFIPARVGIGQALWEGLGERPNNFGAVNSDIATIRMVENTRPDLEPGTPEFDDFLLRKALHAIADHPGFYLLLVIRRCIFVLPCLLILACRTRWKSERWLLAMIAVATIAPYVWIRMEERFWVPASFAYMILAAVATECFLERGQAKRA